MLLTGTTTIRDVILFPTLRPEVIVAAPTASGSGEVPGATVEAVSVTLRSEAEPR
jgi:aspartyl-tRNA synthetase